MAANRGDGSFGSTLREAREHRGISLRQIANTTKISVAVLEALERNDISRLPGGIFSRAFVRAYAGEVGLDPEVTIQQFIAAFPSDAAVTAGHPTSDRFEDFEAVESERHMAGTFLWLAVISVPLVGVLMYLTSPGRESAREAAVPPPSATVVPAPPFAQARPEPARPSEPAAASEPAADSRPAADPDLGPKPVPADSDRVPLPAATQGIVETPADRLTIGISVKRPCWLSVTVDGHKTIERLLQAGESQTVDVRREMVVTAGDAAAIALTFNGAEGRPLGKPGEVVTARFNPANFSRYLQTR